MKKKTDKGDIVHINEMLAEQPAPKNKSVSIEQEIADVQMAMETREGHLESYTMRFAGGSHITFTVEE